MIAGDNLIRVAVTRDPSQAIPIAGSFTAAPSDYLGMTVEVTVTSGRPETVAPPAPAVEPSAIKEQIEIQNEAQNSNAPERLPA